jgi:hypothetical protein
MVGHDPPVRHPTFRDAGVGRAGRAMVAVVPAVGGTTPGAATLPRSTWVWDTSRPEETVAFAVDHGVGRLYAAVPLDVDRSPLLAQLGRLSTTARAAGVRVDALGGDPRWVDDPAWVVTHWLAPALRTELFTGVHLDVEPWTTSAWRTRRADVVRRYVAMLDTLVAAAGTLPVEADVPFWFDEVPSASTTLDRDVLRRVAGVAVMAYRNRAEGVDGSIALSAGEVALGEALGKPVRVGQETTGPGADPSAGKRTFHGFTEAAMEEQLARLSAAHSGSRGFAGLAIHDARGWAAITG